jgi:hypothetical protein
VRQLRLHDHVVSMKLRDCDELETLWSFIMFRLFATVSLGEIESPRAC